MGRKYVRHAILTLSEGQALIDASPSTDTKLPVTNKENKTVQVFTGLVGARLFRHTLTCASCEREGNMFAVERTHGDRMRSVFNDWHLNLYHKNAFGIEMLMTVDHRVSKFQLKRDEIINQG